MMSEPGSYEQLKTEAYALLGALDRCEHGRHHADPCLSCPDRQSTGNLYLPPGTRIGTTLYGEAITVPDSLRERLTDAASWTASGRPAK
jgi:hypothetical protein